LQTGVDISLVPVQAIPARPGLVDESDVLETGAANALGLRFADVREDAFAACAIKSPVTALDSMVTGV